MKGIAARPDRRNTPQRFAIVLSRLPKIENAPGLILLTVDTSQGTEPPAKVGTLTDAALRGRLAHFDQHSANEVAAVRQALGKDAGRATVYESWSGLGNCLQFWHSFIGSQIRPIAWLCDKCGKTARENIGGTVGEALALRCRCGQVKQITVPK